jgi:hypothetical protein
MQDSSLRRLWNFDRSACSLVRKTRPMSLKWLLAFAWMCRDLVLERILSLKRLFNGFANRLLITTARGQVPSMT